MMKKKINKQIKLIRNFFAIDKTIIICLITLCAINIVVQLSANDDLIRRLMSDIIYISVGIIVLFIFANLTTGQIKHVAIPFYVVSLIFLVLVLIIGVRLHGAQRWLNLGIRLQPSELCKLSVPIILAYYFSEIKKKYTWYNYFIGFILILIPFALIVKQPDLGTGILVFFSGFVVLFLAELPWKFIIIALVGFILSTPIVWSHLHEYQQHRILTLLNPQSDPLGKGYHIIQGMIAIGSGGFWGKGYMHGTQAHLNFIPEKHTDFVIAILAEEWGYIGVVTVLTIYLILILRSLHIMRLTTDLFSRLIAGSIILSFTMYILINMGMVSGIFPVVGVPLPFISYGGTATVVLMCGFGILLSIAKQNKY